jgi:hypothetical protein
MHYIIRSTTQTSAMVVESIVKPTSYVNSLIWFHSSYQMGVNYLEASLSLMLMEHKTKEMVSQLVQG